ncbi:pyocin knob domain-containing S74 family peptidase [Enterobacter cloacae]|uniref:pyocin knob domain-containing S74 family peptidase n=1 Tax=Enterobacter cloacae TaxID=550 RepID=UPI0020053BB7|nr:pyocin knob domain-containing S74 family peptidase [Enterobacter cloacae]MCK6742814.1 pyocin knob domain-containing S74 family peptidase [Enterobacter cloacae]MCK6782461.1 pyocin knob domain-containing S74 family peptidase [Enterobacter cloacae]
MADIFSGKNVKIYYNVDTGNRAVVTAGNIEISQLAQYPSFSMGNEVAKIETYNDEYANAITGQQTVDEIEIVVNYVPTDTSHQFLDAAYDSRQEFQITIFYNEDLEAGRLESVMVNGVLASRTISGGKDAVVTMSYSFAPTELVSYAPRAIPVTLHRGDYGVGSDGTVDYPQYEPDKATGNAFVKISAGSSDNPTSVDMMGIELVDGKPENTNIMMTTTGDLRMYARNATTAWTRLYTSNEADTRYLIKSNNLSDLSYFVLARSNLDVYSKTEADDKFMEGKDNLSEITDTAEARTNLDVYSKSETDNLIDSVQTNLDTYITSNTETIDSINTTIIVNKNQVDGLSDTVDGINSNINDLVDVVNANKTQVDDYVTNNNEVIDNISSTLDQLSDSVDTRFGNVVLKTTTVNGKSLTGNITLTKSDVGLGNVTNDAQLKVASNLSDVANVDTARSNLKVDRLKQLSNQTQITNASGDGWLYAGESGLWGYRGSDSTWKPLGIAQGGTGSLTVKGARDNLQAMYRSQASLEATDLNTIDGLNCGFYYQTMTASATAERNYPLVEAGGLIVYQTGANGGTSCIQEYTTFSSLRKFVRSLSSGVWSEWIEQPKLSGNNAWTGINNFSNDLQITGNITSSASFPLKLVSSSPTIQFMETDSGGSTYAMIADGANFRLSRDSTNGATIFNYVRDDNSFNIGQGVLRMVGNVLPTSQGIGVGGYRAIEPGNDYAGFDNMNNINITSWYGIGFCTAYTAPLNGIVAGKPAVYINTRNGTLAAKNAVFANTTQLTSDRNAKDNIEEIPDDDETLEKILGLKTYTFNFKNSGQPSAGFIAQEVQEVFPDYVQFVEDIKHYSLDYTAVNAYLHKAVVHYTDKTKVLETKVQDQQLQIDELKELVQQLLDNK